jgi:hypothetical protein
MCARADDFEINLELSRENIMTNKPSRKSIFLFLKDKTALANASEIFRLCQNVDITRIMDQAIPRSKRKEDHRF